MLNKLVFILLMAASSLFASENLQFGEDKDISTLPVSKETADYRTGSFSKTISCIINSEDIEFFKADQNFDLLKVDGLIMKGTDGEPTSYLKSIKLVLRKNARVTGVKLISGSYVEIQKEINLAPRGKLLMAESANRNDDQLVMDEAIYSRDDYFPGKAVTYISGKDQENTVVYIQFYPVQYNPVKKQVILINNASFKVDYVLENQPSRLGVSKMLSTNAENIILTTGALKPAADSLKQFHELLSGVSTAVILTDSIKVNYTPAENPTQPGIATINNPDLEGAYDYELAKKIVSYLRDNAAHPNLQSITILGDAIVVPSSYYFYIPWDKGFHNWPVSDLFYSSPDYDMVLNYEVGRLPVVNLIEAEAIVQKIKNWLQNLDASWFNNTVLVSGSSPQPHYQKQVWEMSTLEPVHKNYFTGMNIKKCFSTNDKLSKQEVLPHFSDENTGIIYHNYGGINGTSINVDWEGLASGDIYADEMMALPPKQKYPVFFSTSTATGAYDVELINIVQYTHCFAEGLLHSKAGCIAFFGATRGTAYRPGPYMLKLNGEMIMQDAAYMTRMLNNCFKAYSEGKLKFGEISKQAFGEYMQNINTNDIAEYGTAYEFVFLGDPVLSMLPLQSATNYDRIEFETDPLPNIYGSSFDDPVYFRTAAVSVPIDILGKTNSPSVKINIYAYDAYNYYYNSVVNTTVNTPPFVYQFTPPSDKSEFMVSYETEDYKETRLFFKTRQVDKLPPTTCIIEPIEHLGGGNYDINWSKSKDYDGSIVSYTLEELKNPVSVYDSCENLDMWKSDGFIMADLGHNGTKCFYSGFFNTTPPEPVKQITTAYPVFVKPGDTLMFWARADIDFNDPLNMFLERAFLEIRETDKKHFEIITEFPILTQAFNYGFAPFKIDLSAYVNKFIYIQFKFTQPLLSTRKGLLIDNVSLTGSFANTNLIENLTDTTYQISNQPLDTYYYRVKATDNDGLVSNWSNMQKIDLTVGLPEDNVATANLLLSQNYPNPFSNETTISFFLKEVSNVNIEVYDIMGKKVKTLVNRKLQSGKHQVKWNGCGETGNRLPVGLYMYRFEAGNFNKIQKMLMIK